MTTKADLHVVFTQTEAAYDLCWDVLCKLRAPTRSDLAITDLHRFQVTLAEALFRLNRWFQRLERQKQELVNRRTEVPRPWFLSTVKRLGGYQETIDEALTLGRALGDAFAWLFYQRDRDLLKKHADHEAITEFPGPMGAAGELEFLKRAGILDQFFVLYHGITTILRQGDVSFFDLANWRIACLGELKSQQVDTEALKVTVHCIGPNTAAVARSFGVNGLACDPTEEMHPDRAERLDRQLKAMADSFKPLVRDRHLKLEEESYLPALERVCDGLANQTSAFERCGDSLLLAGFRIDTRDFFERLRGPNGGVVELIRPIKEYVLPLLDKSQHGAAADFSRILIGGLRPEHIRPSSIPLFWWPIDLGLLRKMYFQNIVVLTLFNPAHLIRNFLEAGFEVRRIGRSGRYKARKRIGEMCLQMEGLERYTDLVTNSLFREEAVLALFRQMTNLVESGAIKPNSRITLDINQELGSMSN